MAEDLTPDAYETIRQLMQLVTANGLSELTVSQPDGFSVTVKGISSSSDPPALEGYHQPQLALAQGSPQPAPSPARAARAAKGPGRGRSGNAVAMGSPMVGIYYEAPSPGEPPFVKVGDTVQIGTVIGLIEAMKVYSEIPSEVAGRVVEIVARNGVLVQQGEPLIYVEPE